MPRLYSGLQPRDPAMRQPLAIASLLLAASLVGCGQTGPLYLPDEGIETPVEIKPAPPAPATPAATEPAAPDRGEDEGQDAPPPGAGA